MDFITWASTDRGLRKANNQDSISIQVADTAMGRCCLVIACDGMGGLSDGELASASVIRAFRDWFRNSFPIIIAEGDVDSTVTQEWEILCSRLNNRLKEHGSRQGIRIGTTITAALLLQDRYIIMNVGDTRAYEISDTVKQITEDQTFVNREVKAGRMTPEEALTDDRRSVLLQCIGASTEVYPEMFFGRLKPNAVYMLCVDGFRHEITNDEFLQYLGPKALNNREDMHRNCDFLIDENKRRFEMDNITVGVVRTLP